VATQLNCLGRHLMAIASIRPIYRISKTPTTAPDEYRFKPLSSLRIGSPQIDTEQVRPNRGTVESSGLKLAYRMLCLE